MKKLMFSLMLALAATMMCQAEVITADQALAVARGFVNQSGSELKAGAPLKLAYQARSLDGKPDYYVFNNGTDGGFIVVSGDDRTVPIWGYSTSGSFDYESMPDNAKWWYSEYQRQLQYLRDNPQVKARKPVKLTTSVDPLLTTKWNQCQPYNYFCPSARDNADYYNLGGNILYYWNRACTGCVATALAQIMNYHKWPLFGEGCINNFESNVLEYQLQGTNLVEYDRPIKLSADFSTSNYQWNLMKDNYRASFDENGNRKYEYINYSDSWPHWDNVDNQPIFAVAKLMSDVGIAVKMDYGVPGRGGSESTEKKAEAAMRLYFRYNTDLNYRYKYTSEDWDNLLIDQLKVGKPIFYAGIKVEYNEDELICSEKGGHAFVFDGYNEQGMFHVNWGWGGYNDGYYISSLNDDISKNKKVDYQYGQLALFLEPNRTGKRATATLSHNNFGTVNKNSRESSSLSVVGQNLDQNVSISLSGANASMFSTVETVSASEANAEGGKTVTVVYHPTATGDHTAQITVNFGDGIEPVTFTLNGSSCVSYDVTGDEMADVSDVVAAISAVLNGGDLYFENNPDVSTIVAMINAILNDQANVDLDDGLVAYYPFNGDAHDASGHGNDGEVHDLWSTHGVNGDTNGAWHFGGYNHPGYIRIPNSESLKFTDGFSFACYVKPLDWSGMDGWGDYSSRGTHCIFAKDHDRTGTHMVINLDGNDNMIVRAGTGGSYYHQTGWAELNSSDKIDGNKLNEWVHIAVTYSKEKACMYIDGRLVHVRYINADFTEMNRRDLYLGKFSDYWFPFKGVMDEVRIYNRMLTSAEVKDLAADNVVTQEQKNPFKLSQKSVTLAVGESVTVNMINGGGSYSVGSNTGIVDFTLNNTSDSFTLTGVGVGTTNVTVIDVNSQTTIMLPVTVTEPQFNGTIVMQRKYYVKSRGDVSTSWEGHTSDNYAYPTMKFKFDNGQSLYIGYYNAYYWDNSRQKTIKGVHIISENENHTITKDWYIQPRISGEWVNEKLILTNDGYVKYYSNGVLMGEESFEQLDLSNVSTFIVDMDPYGWWYTHYHYMDDFILSTPSTFINDSFDDGVIDLNIWQAPVNPDGVREEDGIMKTEQIRTDQDFHLRSNPIKL